MIKNKSGVAITKHGKDNVRKSTYIIGIYVIISLLNNSSHGAGLGKVIIPIMLYIAIRFSLEIHRKIKLRWIHLLVILLWLSSLMSTGFSQYVSINTDIVSSLIFTLFFILATSVDYNRNEIKYLVRALLFTGVFSSILIIYNFLIGNKTGWAPRYSIEVLGVMKDENYVSAFLMPILALSSYLMFFSYYVDRNKKIILLISSIVISVASLLTGSRAAFVSVVSIFVVLFYMVLLKGKLSIARKLTLSIVGVSLIVIVIVFADRVLPEMISARLFDYKNYTTDIRFTDLWKTSISLFFENPIFGNGLNAIPAVYGIYSHSIYIDLLVGQGIVGFLIFVGVLLNLLKSRKQIKGLLFIQIFAFSLPLMTINGLNTTSIWTHLIFIQILKVYLDNKEVTINEIF